MTDGLRVRLARAALVVAVGGAGAAVTPAAPAVAAPRHVGIVVAGVGRACASAGGTGLAVLGSRFTVRTGQAPPYLGFVLTINGKGTLRPDNTHYWSYWHNTGSGWKYSGTGAAAYHPKAGTVEGWSYVNGRSSPTAPPMYSYKSLCASSDPQPIARTTHPPAPASTHASKTSASHAAAAPHPSSRAVVTQTSPSTAATRPATSAATRQQPAVTARTTSRTTKRTATKPAAPTRHSATAPRPRATSSSARNTPVAAAQALPSAPPVQQSSASSVPAIGTVVALVVLAAIGGLAFWRTRRRVE